MKTVKILGIVILVLGLLIVIYGGFSYTKKTREANIGSLELSVNQKQNVYIPIWVGIIGIVTGTGLLFLKQKK